MCQCVTADPEYGCAPDKTKWTERSKKRQVRRVYTRDGYGHAKFGDSHLSAILPPRIDFRVSILGDSGVGKTSLYDRLTYQAFEPDKYRGSLNIEFGTHEFDYEGDLYSLQLFDTHGQERFDAITRLYYRSAVILLVFDLTNPSSFENLINKWLPDARSKGSPTTLFWLIGAKSDLVDENYTGAVVKLEDIQRFSEPNGFPYFATSAKLDVGVTELFMDVKERIVAMFNRLEDEGMTENLLGVIIG